MNRGNRELILLGTGTSFGVPMIGCHCETCQSDHPRNQRSRTGVLIEAPGGNILIDTSPDLRSQLLRERIDVVHAAIYTHAHADHIYGLDDLRLFGHRLDQQIPLYCEPSVADRIREAFSYAFTPPNPSQKSGPLPRFEFQEIGLESFQLLGQEIQPIRLMHGDLPILGYRFGDVAFCTDVSLIPRDSFSQLANLRVLIIDALRYRSHPTHFNLKQAQDLIDELQPKQAYLTHTSHDLEYETTNAQLPNGVELAYDGLRIPLEVDR